MRRILHPRMIDVREPESRLVRPSVGMMQMLMGAGGGPVWGPGSAYSETFNLTVATLLGNPIYKGATTLGFQWTGGSSATINQVRSNDAATDQFVLEWDGLDGTISKSTFESLAIQGKTYLSSEAAGVTPYSNDGKGGEVFSNIYWLTGTNGVTVQLLTDGATTLTLTAFVLDAAGTLTVGNYSTSWGRYVGSYGAWSVTRGPTPYHLYYLSSDATTYIQFGTGSDAIYYGPTLKARYAGTEYLFTESPTVGAIGRYAYAGDPFLLNGYVGNSRFIEIVSVGS